MNKNLILIMVLLMSYSVYTTFLNLQPTAEDWNRYHSKVVSDFSKGDFDNSYYNQTLVSDKYPHLFHCFMIVPFMLLGENIRFFQIAMMLMVLVSFYFYMKKYEPKAMMLFFAVLLTCNVFMLYYTALIPQVLDWIIFPIFMIAFFEKKYMMASILTAALMYNHLFGIVFLSAVALYTLLFQRSFIKYLLVAIVLSLPILISFYTPIITDYLMALISGSGMSSSQIWFSPESIFYVFPISHLFIFSGLVLLMLPFTVFALYKKRTINRQQAFYICLMLCFLPIFFFNFFRAWTFFIIPLTLFQASKIGELIIERKSLKLLTET
jgi:hypothetical protein